MTHERDFDRIARAWLELGPGQAPDRAVAAVLAAIETTPQARRPWRWPIWRYLHMSPRTFALVGALTLALVIGGSLITRNQAQISHPTEPPSPSPVPASAYQPLIGTWAGSPKTLADLTRSAIVRSTFDGVGRWDVSGTALVFGRFHSIVDLVAADRLTLTTDQRGRECQPTDVGTYRFQLSPGGKRLTLTAESDPCLNRRVIAEGEWVRNDCQTGPGIAGGDWDCYGDLEAGTYRSREVNLRADAAGSVEVVYGALTFTVPAGWTHVADNATRFWLMKSDQFPHLQDGTIKDASIYVFGHPQAASQADGCPAEPQPGVGLAPSDLMSFFRTLPSVRTSTPQAITISGRSGQWVDIELDPSWTKTCPWYEDGPVAPIFLANTGVDGVIGQTKRRIYVLDIGHGNGVLVQIVAEDPARWDALIAEATPIVESFVFAEPGTTP